MHVIKIGCFVMYGHDKRGISTDKANTPIWFIILMTNRDEYYLTECDFLFS